MRFSALLYKELRECLPWLLLAAIVFIAASSIILRMEILNESFINHRLSRFSPGNTIGYYEFTYYPNIKEAGIWLFLLSIGLGLVLGVRQFWLPNFTRTWPFLLHRSVRRETILAAKLIAAILTLVISLGLTWVAIYWYASKLEAFKVPLPFRVFFEGCIFIIIGFVIYLGTALSGLSRAKWYTTKIFGIAFTFLFIFIILTQLTLAWAVLIITFSMVILLSQIIHTFGGREF
jgi:hypothetical protein